MIRRHPNIVSLLAACVLSALLLTPLYWYTAQVVIDGHEQTITEQMESTARRIAGGLADRWEKDPPGDGPCYLSEPDLAAVWGLDRKEICRSAYVTSYYDSVLDQLLDRAARGEPAKMHYWDRDTSHDSIYFPYADYLDYMALGVPITVAGKVKAVVFVTGLAEPVEIVPSIRLAFFIGGFILTGLLWGGSLAFRKLDRDGIGAMRKALRILAEDDPAANGGISRLPEIVAGPAGSLAADVNRMLEYVDNRLQDLTHRLGEREAMLESMVEGVLAVDSQNRLIELNRAAADMFGLDSTTAKGRPLLETLRNPGLHRFIGEALASTAPVEQELTLLAGAPRFLQLHGTVLRDGEGNTLGALVVFNDVTRLRKLERMRSEFVANVSHELKTPITSIKGYVETLLEGPPEDPAQARVFLETVGRHADRLNAIIDDLLSLSRIEQDAESGPLQTEFVPLALVLETALRDCSEKAAAKKIETVLECDAGLEAHLNQPLVEQAAVNLIDNAIKYAPPGTSVTVRGGIAPGASGDVEVVLSVQDEGPGIPLEHQDRLFERFYRVDRSRSRKEGGTGLGLAIVKHIAQAHGGRVTVESSPGQGSTFSMILPAPPPPSAAVPGRK